MAYYIQVLHTFRANASDFANRCPGWGDSGDRLKSAVNSSTRWTCLRCLDRVRHHHAGEQNMRVTIVCHRPGGRRCSRGRACCRTAEAAPMPGARGDADPAARRGTARHGANPPRLPRRALRRHGTNPP
jgi:hypothetical protein